MEPTLGDVVLEAVPAEDLRRTEPIAQQRKHRALGADRLVDVIEQHPSDVGARQGIGELRRDALQTFGRTTKPELRIEQEAPLERQSALRDDRLEPVAQFRRRSEHAAEDELDRSQHM